MEFERFPSMQNEYAIDFGRRQKYYDELGRYIVTEKIDGCNISLYISKNEMKYAKRTGFTDESFYNIGAYIHELDKMIAYFQSILDKDEYFVLYGEFYGRQVLTRVCYKGVGFRFYAMKIGSVSSGETKWTSFKHFQEYMEPFKELIVPIIGIFDNVTDALKVPTVFHSALVREDNTASCSEAEGYVVAPYDYVPFSEDGTVSYCIKHKNMKFFERVAKPRPIKTGKTVNLKSLTEQERFVYKLHEAFLEYFNENRVYSLISKIGRVESMKDLGAYVSALYKDCYEDFIIDFPEVNSLTPSELKNVTKVGNIAFELVKKYALGGK